VKAEKFQDLLSVSRRTWAVSGSVQSEMRPENQRILLWFLL
jgi:hypothetical protein